MIHASFVEEAIHKQDPNPLLQRRPFPIHPSEQKLPRNYRAALSQLRSGHSIILNSYKHTINSATSPLCTRCGLVDDTVEHLFDCTANPTPLTLSDLWLFPLKVATFLSSLDIPDLPPLPPPPPEPPPSPPSTLDSTLFSPLSLGQSFFYSSISSSSSNESLNSLPPEEAFLLN